MTQHALVLAAHGSRRYPASLDALRAHATALAARGRWSTVTPAFVYGSPSLAEVVAQLDDQPTVVVPFFMAEGYFARAVLPRELGLAARPHWRMTRPLGCHDGLREVVLARVEEAIGAERGQADLLLVGHGTERDRASRETTFAHAAALAGAGFAAVQTAFLEEPPLIADALAALGAPTLCVVPLFVADALHTIEDIPHELGLPGQPGAWVTPSQVGGRLIHYTSAVGNDPAVVDLLAALAGEAG